MSQVGLETGQTNMMDLVRLRKRKWKRNNNLRFEIWNIRSWNGRYQEMIIELEEKKIGMRSPKQKRKVGKQQPTITVCIHNDVDKDKKGKEEIGLLVHKKFENNLEDVKYMPERILATKLTIDKIKLNIISVYEPEDCKSNLDKEKFYEDLQSIVNAISNTEHWMLTGDFNARVSNNIVLGIK